MEYIFSEGGKKFETGGRPVYEEVFYTSWKKRFPESCEKIIKRTALPKETTKCEKQAPNESVKEIAPSKPVRHLFPLMLTFVFTAAVLVFAALSYFGIFPDATKIYGNADFKDILSAFDGSTVIEVLLIGLVPGLFCAALIFNAIQFILSVAAFSTKRRIAAFWVPSYLAFASLIGNAVAGFILSGGRAKDILVFINPFSGSGLIFGYYILLVRMLISLISTTISYQTKKVV